MIPSWLQAARLRLSHERPYIATALWTLRPVARPGLQTMAVDRYWRLYYDPALRWGVQGTATVLYHEIAHLLRGHPERFGDSRENPCLINVVTDLEINDDLEREGLLFPVRPLFPRDYGLPSGLLAEEYLALFKQGAQLLSLVGGSHCGSCAHGQALPWEDPSPKGGLSPLEAELIRKKVAAEIWRHHRERGDLPGHWLRWAQGLLQPKLNWQRELALVLHRALGDTTGAVDYSYRRPSRRQSAYDPVVIPALRHPLPEVAVLLDSSESIRKEELGAALGEIQSLLRARAHREINVILCDATVQEILRVGELKALLCRLKGGGGTDLRQGFQAALGLRPRPSLLVVFTDGYTPWPQTPPPFKTVVVRQGNGAVPSWAKLVDIG